MQQQIQVSAAEARGVDERLTQAEARRERLVGEEKALAAIEPGELEAAQRAAARPKRSTMPRSPRVADWQARVPALDDERKSLQDLVNEEARRHAELSARLAALQALQEKVQVENKLKPWLSRHGLESLAGLWTRIRIEPGWEAALEAALRERLGALEIGRLDTVRAFAADAPPSRLAFFTRAAAAHPTRTRRCRGSPTCSTSATRASALLGDWLEGVYTASDFDAALAARSRLTHGEVIMTREGHAVSQFAVSFYAPDSEQAGLLARAQEIENLDRQTRAQALVSEESRSRLVRAEAASTEAAAHSSPRAARRRPAAVARAPQHLELVRLTQLAEQTQARREQLGGERGALDAELAELAARRTEAKRASTRSTSSSASPRSARPSSTRRRSPPSAALDAAREQQRDLERQAQEAQFELRSLAARRHELERSIETARQQLQDNGRRRRARRGARPAHRRAGAGRAAERAGDAARARATLGEKRSLYDDLSQRLRRADEARLGHEQALQPLRDKVSALQLEAQAAQLGGAQYAEQLDAASADRETIARSDRGRRRQARRPAGQDRRAQPRDRGARRGQPRGARGARPGARAKGLPRRAERRPAPKR